jgi:hypothetical protein
MEKELTCEFCYKSFSSKSNLTAHKSRAKYCISKRNGNIIIPDISYKCSYCEKSFTTKQFLATHKTKCNNKILKEQSVVFEQKLEEQKRFFERKLQEQKILFENTLHEREKLLQEKDTINFSLKEQIESLQVKITSIAIEGYRNKTRDNLYEENLQQEENKYDSSPWGLDSVQRPKEDFTQVQEEKDSSLVLKDSYQLVYRPEDGYIDVTNLCNAGKKKFNDWKRLNKTTAFLKVLSSSAGNPANELLKYQNGSNAERKTWVHPQVAINIAQWISPEFDVQVSRWIYQIMLTGKTDIRDSKTTQQLDQLSKENKQYAEKIEFFERKYIQRNRRVDYTDQNVVYIITTESRELKKEYKIGKTQDLTNRLSTYNTTEDHKVVFFLECESQDEMNTLEKIVFTQLSHLRIRADREWFCGEVEQMIKTVKECKDFIVRDKK